LQNEHESIYPDERNIRIVREVIVAYVFAVWVVGSIGLALVVGRALAFHNLALVRVRPRRRY
jgi:hypothetical protein